MVSSKPVGIRKEFDKAARVIQYFVDKGKIPTQVVANAKGVAIFTVVRAGMCLAGSGGTGVVVARLPDGEWTPPSTFSVRSGSFGIVYGVDVYDCVCVLNTQEAVDAYTKPEMNLGGTASVAAGPLGANANIHGLEVKGVWTYTRSRGLYGGMTVDGTVIREKSDTNVEIYGSNITAAQILRGEVKILEGGSKWPMGSNELLEILKLAEGKATGERRLQGSSSA